MARKSRSQSLETENSPVTVNDVAKKAGVSPITVSRALHRPELVSESTREHVLRVVQEMGYVPNLMAGGLATRKSRLVSILLPTVANTIYANAVQSIMNRLAAAGYQSMIGTTGYSPEREEELLHSLLGRRPDGIVLTGTLHTPTLRSRLMASGIPVVEAWDLSTDSMGIQVGFSHEAVGETVADVFHAKGYRRWAVVSVNDPRALRRYRSLVDRLKQHEIHDVANEILPLPATWEVGRRALASLCSKGALPQLIVCSSDTIAFGVLAEAACRGIQIPRDLAVLGFGDITNSRFSYPALSTVSVNASRMGTEVANALLRCFEGNRFSEQINTGFGIVERDST